MRENCLPAGLYPGRQPGEHTVIQRCLIQARKLIVRGPAAPFPKNLILFGPRESSPALWDWHYGPPIFRMD